MQHEEFIEKCKTMVFNRVKELVKFTNVGNESCPEFSVFVVWSCKTLQNSKAILSATCHGAPLYEITMNGDKGEIYIDTYIKGLNECVKI